MMRFVGKTALITGAAQGSGRVIARTIAREGGNVALADVNEEKLLTAELEGYADYKKKVKYRLIPFIW